MARTAATAERIESLVKAMFELYGCGPDNGFEWNERAIVKDKSRIATDGILKEVINACVRRGVIGMKPIGDRLLWNYRYYLTDDPKKLI